MTTGDADEGTGPPGTAQGDLLLGRYRRGARLARGGMGVLYAGTDEHSGAPVVLKVMRSGLFEKQELRRRFSHEIAAARALDHPHIVRLLDHGQDEHGAPVLVMERLFGSTLGDLLQAHGRLALDEALGIALPLMAALDYAHRRGVVHRDLSPDNVFLARSADGAVAPKLLDFGIAVVADASRLTGTGVVVGTLPYVAPEQILHGQASPQSDVWSVGVLLFHCLSGQRPHRDAPAPDLLAHIVKHPVPPLVTVAPSLPPRLAAAVDRALAHRLDRRYRTMAEFAAALRAVARADGLGLPSLAGMGPGEPGLGEARLLDGPTVVVTVPIAVTGDRSDD